MEDIDWIRVGLVAGRELGARTDAKLIIVPERAHSSYRVYDLNSGVDKTITLRKWTDGDLAFHIGYEAVSNTLVIAQSEPI